MDELIESGMTYSNALTSHYLALAKQPISPGNFAGEDCRFSPEYEALESELGKAASLHHAGTVDWQRVASGAEAIIAQQAKDLRAATRHSVSGQRFARQGNTERM